MRQSWYVPLSRQVTALIYKSPGVVLFVLGHHSLPDFNKMNEVHKFRGSICTYLWRLTAWNSLLIFIQFIFLLFPCWSLIAVVLLKLKVWYWYECYFYSFRFQVLIDSRHVPLAEILTAAQRFNVPVVVDAAAQLPPRSNLWRWTHQGVDAVIFSGGKSLRGPQTSGLVLARSELVRKMALNGSPHETTVCRPMKCSKEDMVGLVKAVELYVQDTDEKDFKRYQDVLDIIEAGLKSVPGIAATQQRCPSPGYIQPNTVPRLFIDLIEGPSFTEKKESATSEGGMYAHNVDFGNPLAINPVSAPTALARHLAVGTPTVCVNTSATGIIISPLMMTVKDARPVLQKIVDVCQHMVQVGELLEKWSSRKSRVQPKTSRLSYRETFELNKNF